MKKVLLFIMLAISFSAQADKCPNRNDIIEKLEELNNACEVAREEKIAPLRAKYIKECVQKQKKDREYCERFYKDYGARAGTRPALFRDLPECVEAWKFQKKCRNR